MLLSEARSRSRKPGLYILHPTMMLLISSCRSQLFCVRRTEGCIKEIYLTLVQIFVGQIKSSDLQLDVVVPIVNSFVLIRTQQKLAKMLPLNEEKKTTQRLRMQNTLRMGNFRN